MQHRHSSSLATTLAALAFLASCGSGGNGRSNSTNDTTPPVAGTVRDGLVGDASTTPTATAIHANWSGFVDDSGPIAEYDWAIGTTPGGTDVQGWTSVGTATLASNTSLALSNGTTCYASVRALDGAGNESAVATSNGITVDEPPGGGGSGPTSASMITQWGITWQFAQTETVGRFCNGDWWVLGPVDIVAISPQTQDLAGRQINGSMVNPVNLAGSQHGYDSMLYHPFEGTSYQPSLNRAIGVSPSSPLTLQAGSSLISVVSYLGASPSASGSLSQLSTAAVLTVLGSVPPQDAFRPPYAGTDKTVLHRESDLDYSRLASLVPASGAPDVVATANNFARVWLDHSSGWGSRYMHPIENMPDYGRDFTTLWGTGCLLLQTNLSNAQKRDLLVRLVQIGLDFWGNVQNGASWEGVGGQCSGRKFPILFAGALLNDAAMLGIGTTHPSGYYGPNHPNNASRFGEDCQTFYVQQTSPGVYNWGYGGYTSTWNGMPEWGNNHTTYPSNDHSDWNQDPYRRCCTGNAWVGQCLTARIMGLRDEWNHPAYFDYMDRFMQTEGAGEWTRAWDQWQANMWDLHRATF